jgi:hypothetical protein
MTKPKAAEPQGDQRSLIGSGSYPAVRDENTSTAIVDIARQDSSVVGVPHEIWLRVSWWIAQLPTDDPRRRLLQLAELRRDVKLADTLLRHL